MKLRNSVAKNVWLIWIGVNFSIMEKITTQTLFKVHSTVQVIHCNEMRYKRQSIKKERRRLSELIPLSWKYSIHRPCNKNSFSFNTFKLYFSYLSSFSVCLSSTKRVSSNWKRLNLFIRVQYDERTNERMKKNSNHNDCQMFFYETWERKERYKAFQKFTSCVWFRH